MVQPAGMDIERSPSCLDQVQRRIGNGWCYGGCDCDVDDMMEMGLSSLSVLTTR